jgi:hypothetical protein
MVDHALEQVVSPFGPVDPEHGVDRLEPVLRFLGVEIVVAQSD